MCSAATDSFTVGNTAERCKKFVEVQLPLVSVGRLCAHGMTVVFDADNARIFSKEGRLLECGRRDPFRNVCLLPINLTRVEPGVDCKKTGVICAEPGVPRDSARLTNQLVAANAYEIKAVPALIAHHHASIGFIPKATFIDGVLSGFYDTWPGLSADRVRRFLKKSEIAPLGHMKLLSEGIRSTTRGPRTRKPKMAITAMGMEEIVKELSAPVKTDDTTANGIVDGTAKQQRSKAIDMRCCWLKDRVEQGQFKIFWEPGDANWADCFTKHHPPTHHKKIRPACLLEDNSPADMQGCLDLIKGHQPAGSKAKHVTGLPVATGMAAAALARPGAAMA